MVRRGERSAVIDGDRDLPGAAGTVGKLQAGKGCSAASQNEHHGPLKRTERARERPFVDGARGSAVSRMRMQPKSRKPLGLEPGIDLFVEIVGHGRVLELHADRRTTLT
ncbi:MAG: hypothetical protein C0483_11200 [Pirellula sp.]|nr:hypothetical protein [Pirellula sp.]